MSHKFEKLKLILLERKLQKLDKINYINSGGCAIVAYALSKYLKGINTEIIYLLTNEDLNDNVISKIRNGEPTHCHHSVLKINDKYIDTIGACSKYEMFERWSDFNTVSWNMSFSREYDLHLVDSILNLKGSLLNEISL